MISYRELAMRVVGKPLRTKNIPPMAHRATALALTAAMMAALAAPAFAGWTIDMSQVSGDVTITRDENGNTTIKIGDSDADQSSNFSDGNDGDDSITITDSRNDITFGNTTNLDGMFNGTKDLTGTDLDKSDTSNISGTTNQTKTLEADETPAPVVTDEDTTDDDTTYTEPTPVVTWPDEDTDETPDPEQPEGETEADPGEQPEGTDSEAGEPAPQSAEGENPENLVSTLEAPAEGLPVTAASQSDEEDENEPETYLGKAAKAVTRATNNAFNAIIKIFNYSSGTLNVTLDGVKVDATDRNDSALTVSGYSTSNTTLTLKGDNELKGGAGKDGLNQFGGSLTITGNKNDKLTATGGDSTNWGGDGIYSDGGLTINGGTITANGGKATGEGSTGGSGIRSRENECTVTINGGTVTATGGAGIDDGGAGIQSNTVTIQNGNVTAQGGEATGSGGDGIYSDNLTIMGGIIEATGGNASSRGGAGINSGNTVTIGTTETPSTATIKKAQGGSGEKRNGGAGIYAKKVFINGGTIGELDEDGKLKEGTGTIGGSGKNGGAGIYGSTVNIMGGTIHNAQGGTGNGGSGGGAGIHSGVGGVTIGSDDTTATTIINNIQGGNGINSVGGNGIFSAKGTVTIKNAKIDTITGGNGSNTGGSGIRAGTTISVEGDSVVKATAGKGEKNNGNSFSNSSGKLTLEEVSKNLSENGYVGAVEADGTGTAVGKKPEGFDGPDVPIPEPEQPETPAPVIPSDDDTAPAPEEIVITPAGVPGFAFTGMLGNSISVKADVNGSTMEFATMRYAAALHTTLGQLRQLKEQGITHVTFKTMLCTTTFAIDDLLPLGDDATEVVLSHNGKAATLTVGGVER